MKTAVDAVFAGKARRFNRRFEQMCSHYLIEPVACTPASGWEKGQVENQVGNVRGPETGNSSVQSLDPRGRRGHRRISDMHYAQCKAGVLLCDRQHLLKKLLRLRRQAHKPDHHGREDREFSQS